MKPGPDRDECCYPFIYETAVLCDYEVVTDELCGHLGAALSLLPEAQGTMRDIAADLDRLQPLAFHVNGSVRGRLAVTEADLEWLRGRHASYRAEIGGRVQGFVLPRGAQPVPELHRARSSAKKAIRCLVRVEAEGRQIPPVLPRLLNLMCNFCFTLTLVINQRRGFAETAFESASYAR